MSINLDDLIKTIYNFLSDDNVTDFNNEKLKLPSNYIKILENLKNYILEKDKKASEEFLNLQTEKIKYKELLESINSKKTEITLREKTIEEKDTILKEKEKELLSREENAFNGFVKEQEEAIIKTKQKLEEETGLLSKNLNELREQKIKLEEEHTKQLKENEEKLNALFSKRKQELDNNEKELEKSKEELKILKTKLDAEYEKLKEEQELLTLRKNDYDNLLKQYNTQLENTVDIRIKDSLEMKESEIKSLQVQLGVLKEDYNRVLEVKTRFEQEEIRSGGLSKEELNKKIIELESLLKVERDKVLSFPTDYDEISRKAQEVDRLKEDVITLKTENEKLKAIDFSKDYYAVQVEQLKNNLTLKEFQCAELETLLTECKAKLEAIKNKYEHKEEMDKRVSDLKQSYAFESAKNYIEDINTPTEIKWILDIHDKCEKSKIIFDKRLLFAFHTALKSAYMSPLTILSGVSGTGKSELPKLYSRFGGLYFISLPVKPDWDSPQSLFGYFNSLDGKYNSTELLKAMIQFDSSNNVDTAVKFKDSILLVLLDEMNLAHVELYFSDLLSKLETRRGSNKPENIDIDLGSGFSYKLSLGENILWTGTMNEDETTKALSDKVIDRGYQINFPIPDSLFSRDDYSLQPEMGALKYSIWTKWKKENYIDNKDDETKKIFNNYNSILNEIKSSLVGTGRGLGHRVWQAVDMYMRLHPVNSYYYKKYQQDKTIEAEYKKSLELSFEEALVYKVMPKLRGLELGSDITRNALDKIQGIINDKVPGLKSDYNKAMNTPDEQFIWCSAEYLSNNKDFYDHIK